MTKYSLKDYYALERQELVLHRGGITTNTTVTGDGFNSEDHNYEFFNVLDYIAGTPSQLVFN